MPDKAPKTPSPGPAGGFGDANELIEIIKRAVSNMIDLIFTRIFSSYNLEIKIPG